MTTRIPSLDGLRAIAVMMVMIKHAENSLPLPELIKKPLVMFLGSSHIGVEIFFVISGYLITFLLLKETQKHGTINLKAFYFRRSLRIFPAFYLYIFCIAALTFFGFLAVPLDKILAAASYTWNYSHFYVAPIREGAHVLGHFWTLALEEQFYLFWPLTLFLLKEKRATFLAFFLIFFLPFVRVATYLLFPAQRPYIGMMLHTSADLLMFGCLLALLQDQPRFESFVARLQNGLIPLGAIFVTFILSPMLWERFQGAYLLPIGRTLEALGISILILYVTRFPQTLLAQFLNLKPLVWIGVLSYSLYLWNSLVFAPENTTWTRQFPLNFLAVLALAMASHYGVEKPFLRLKDRFARSEKKHLPSKK